jgi:TIR domain/AAA ATPase domain
VARVFISHAGEDRDVAAEVHRWLVYDGHEVFLDQDLRDALAGGEEWEARLYERLRWADAVVCVVTAAYLASVWCTAEVECARQRGSRVVPLLVEPGVVHPLLTKLQHIDYAHDPSTTRSTLREALRRIDAAGGRGWPDGRNPFPGLRPFDTDLHRAFFGRGEEVEELAGRVRSQAAMAGERRRLVLVVGPSGCGKSSLVRAGLLPVIAEEVDWLTIPPFFPGRDPLSTLAGELAVAGRRQGLEWTLAGVRERIASGELAALADELLVVASNRHRRRHLLIVLDQLEELLIQAELAGRAAFAAALMPALAGPVHIVATMRPESLPELLASQELAGLPLHTFTLRPLGREVLPEVIEGPARLAGIGVDERLLHRVVADTGSGEALPLLAFTLSELSSSPQLLSVTVG